MPRYTFQRGETIRFAVDVLSADGVDPADAIVTARIARKSGGTDAADFDVEPREDGGATIGWFLTLDREASAALPEGRYELSYRVSIGGDDEIPGVYVVFIENTPSSGA